MRTNTEYEIRGEMLCNYFNKLIGKFFKIIPLKEMGEPSLNEFMKSLRSELLGCQELIYKLSDDSMMLSLIATLEYLIEKDCELAEIRKEVFKAISICKQLCKKYGEKEG